MNQSLSKLSERLRNNSSNSSIGGVNSSKLKLKFKPAKQSDNNKLIEKFQVDNRKIVHVTNESSNKRDRNSRTGLKGSITAGFVGSIAKGLT